MRALFVRFVRALFVLFLVSTLLFFCAYFVIIIFDKLYDGDIPNLVRTIILLVFVSMYVLAWNATAADPYRRLQNERRSAKNQDG